MKTQTLKKYSHVKAEAEIGVLLTLAKELLGYQSQKRQGKVLC